jgi:type I restriction enzyme, S subunit
MKLGPGHIEVSAPELPPGWVASRIGDCCQTFQGGRLGLTKEKHYRSSGVPAFSAAGQDGFVDVAEYEQDGVVLSAIGANCGRCFYATGKWTTLANVQAIIPDPQKLSARFLFHRANIDNFWSRSGSAQPFIKPTDVHSSWVAHPRCVAEQLTISQVIDAVDQAIEQTEALLAKQQRVKTGLIHDLLTRGLDAQSRLRDPSTHRFKTTDIGDVPSDWVVVPIESLVPPTSPICYGIVQVGHHTYGGVPTIAIRDLNDIRVANLHHTDPEREKRFARSRCQGGDVLISIKATTGRIGVAPDGFKGNISRDIARVRLLPSECPAFFKYQLQSAAVQSRLDSIAVGTTRKELSIIPLRLLLVSRPKPDEQLAIATRIQKSEADLFKLERTIVKLHLLKAGLMDDLLTGDITVTPLLSNSAS